MVYIGYKILLSTNRKNEGLQNPEAKSPESQIQMHQMHQMQQVQQPVQQQAIDIPDRLPSQAGYYGR